MPAAISNRLLACLTPECRTDVMSRFREVDLPVNTVLYEADREVTDAYFINSGFASQVIYLGDAGSAEVGVVGLEGFVGATALLGRPVAPGRCFMQASGAGYVIPLETLRQAFTSSEEIRSRVLEYVQHQMLTGT
jgi:CRP-like cAMP-binding protein